MIERELPINGITTNHPTRYGRRGKVPAINTKASPSTRTLWERSICVQGVQLFNTIPAYIRNQSNCSVQSFKRQLDKVVTKLDEPQISRYT